MRNGSGDFLLSRYARAFANVCGAELQFLLEIIIFLGALSHSPLLYCYYCSCGS